jgi:hypothetical protein
LRAFLPALFAIAYITAAPAAVVEDKDRFGNVDGRGALDEKAEQLGLSGTDVARLRGATGYVICPGSAHGNGIVASAALVENARIIVTVGHAFVDENGKARGPLTDCIFRNQASSPAEVRLVGEGAIWNGLDDAATPHDPRDYAVAVLARDVPGASPLRWRSDALPAGERVVGIVAWQEIEGKNHEAGMPVVQDCAVRDFDPGSGEIPVNYLTDCDLGPVGSGGHILTNVGGTWATSGIFSTSGGQRSVGRSFSRRLGQYTRAIGIDGGVVTALEESVAALRGSN